MLAGRMSQIILVLEDACGVRSWKKIYAIRGFHFHVNLANFPCTNKPWKSLWILLLFMPNNITSFIRHSRLSGLHKHSWNFEKLKIIYKLWHCTRKRTYFQSVRGLYVLAALRSLSTCTLYCTLNVYVQSVCTFVKCHTFIMWNLWSIFESWTLMIFVYG